RTEDTPDRRPPRVRRGGRRREAGERTRSRSTPRDLAELVGLDDVALLEVLEVGEADAALVAGGDLGDLVLDALERLDLALPDHRALTEEAHLGATGDDAVQHVATGDPTHGRHPEDLAHLGVARDHLFVLRREQAEHGV